jgi:hypothetical protein
LKPFIINRDFGSDIIGAYIITVSSWVNDGADTAQSYLADVDNAFKIMKEILVDSDMEVSPAVYGQSHSRDDLQVNLDFAFDGLTFDGDLYLGAGTDDFYLDWFLNAMNKLGNTTNRPLDHRDIFNMRVAWTDETLSGPSARAASDDLEHVIIVNLSKIQEVVA